MSCTFKAPERAAASCACNRRERLGTAPTVTSKRQQAGSPCVQLVGWTRLPSASRLLLWNILPPCSVTSMRRRRAGTDRRTRTSRIAANVLHGVPRLRAPAATWDPTCARRSYTRAVRGQAAVSRDSCRPIAGRSSRRPTRAPVASRMDRRVAECTDNGPFIAASAAVTRSLDVPVTMTRSAIPLTERKAVCELGIGTRVFENGATASARTGPGVRTPGTSTSKRRTGRTIVSRSTAKWAGTSTASRRQLPKPSGFGQRSGMASSGQHLRRRLRPHPP
jgi:hypothetical protein